MKKIFILIAVLACTFTAKAQDEIKGIWVGGSVAFSSTKGEEATKRSTRFSIMPEVGYMVSENWGVAIAGGYETEKDVLDGFSVRPFARYSFCKGDLGSLFVDGGVGLIQTKFKGSDLKTTKIEVGLRPGVALNVTKHVALTAKFGFLGYENVKRQVLETDIVAGTSEKKDRKSNRYGLELNMDDVMLGVNFVF